MAAGVSAKFTAVPLYVLAVPAAAGAVCIAASGILSKKRQCKGLFIQFLIFFILFFIGYFITFTHDISDNKVQTQEKGIITARVTKVVDSGYSVRIMLNNCIFDGKRLMNGVVLELSAGDENASVIRRGDNITAGVVMDKPPSADNPGQFDSRAYYKSLGYSFYVKKPEIINVTHGKNILIYWLDDIKLKLKSVYAGCCDAVDAGVYEAMVLGDKSDMDKDINDLFSSAGIGHILAISGLHISMIGMGLFGILRRCGAGYSVAAAVSGVLVILYGVMTGSSVSSVRAIVMFGCAVYAQVIGRTYDILSAVSLAAIIIIFKNPYIITNSGFLLSFLAIAGVSAVSGGFMVKRLKWLTSPLAIWLSTLPVMLWFYYEIPMYSIILNLVVVPLMSFIMVSALLCGIAGIFSPALGSFFAGVGHYMLVLFRCGCSLMLSLPGSVYTAGRPKIYSVIIYYLVLVLFSLRKNIVRCVRRMFENAQGGYKKELCRRCERLTGMLIGLLIIPALAVIFTRTRKGLQVVFLDVGQGDAIFIGMPGGENIFIDGGSSSQTGVYDKVIEPFFKFNGIRRLDFLFISHGDEDHYNAWTEAAQSVIDGSRIYVPVIDNVVLSANDYHAYMEKEGSRRVIMDMLGTVYDFGECSLTSLNECRYSYGMESSNDNSVVLLLRYGEYSILFTGDVTSDREKLIASRIEACGVNSLSLLKAAHHGSKYSTSEAFLESVMPKAAVISCAARNSYGHPHPETLNRLDEVHTRGYRVDECGAVIAEISAGAECMTVYGYNEAD